MLGPRLLILVVVLMGLTALAATVAPRDGAFKRSVTPAQPAQTPAAPPAGDPEAGPAAGPAAPADPVPGEPATIRLDAAGARRVVDAPVG
ncbi:MAG TPA: hypothetical protein VF533_10145, partial [Solirubrobacteraceae bacterium]